ncbi:hypothetical protein ACFL6R_05670, partial [Gemmatimonadota bacterium]
ELTTDEDRLLEVMEKLDGEEEAEDVGEEDLDDFRTRAETGYRRFEDGQDQKRTGRAHRPSR